MDAAKRKRIVALVNGRAADRPQGIELVMAADDHELWTETLGSLRRHGNSIETSHLALLDGAPDDHPDAIRLRASTTTLSFSETIPDVLRKLGQLQEVTVYGEGGGKQAKRVTGLERLGPLTSLRKLHVRSVDFGDGAPLAVLGLHELSGYLVAFSTLPVVRAALVQLQLAETVTTLGAGLPATRRIVLSGAADLADLGALSVATSLEEVELLQNATSADFGPIARAIAAGAPLRRILVARAPRLETLAPFTAAGELHHLELGGLDALSSVAAVASLPSLTHLALRGAAVLRDLGPLSSATSLTVLDLRDAKQVADLRPLASSRSLRVIALAGTAVQPGKVPPALAPYCTWARVPVLDLLARRPAHHTLAAGAA